MTTTTTATTTAAKHTTETTTGRTTVPTWAALKTAYKGAEGRGVKARSAAYDAIARGFALTAETESDAKSGAVKARSEASRAREVIDAFKIESGNVFGLSPMRIAQVVKVYAATARAGLDPFSDAGRKVFTPLDQVRKFDADALNKVADAVKGAPDKADKILSDAVETAKDTAKNRKAAKAEPKSTTVTSLKGVTEFATGALAIVRKDSATATPEDKAALKAALEALLAHVQ